jgi:hypothetical protein
MCIVVALARGDVHRCFASFMKTHDCTLTILQRLGSTVALNMLQWEVKLFEALWVILAALFVAVASLQGHKVKATMDFIIFGMFVCILTSSLISHHFGRFDVV